MNKRVITGIIFILVVLAFVVPGIYVPGLTAAFLILVALGCGLEYYRAMMRPFKRLSLGMTLGGVLTAAAPLVAWVTYRGLRPGWLMINGRAPAIDANWRTDMVWLTFIGLGCFALIAVIYSLAVLIFQVMRHGPGSIPTAFAALSAVPYIAAPFACGLIFLYGVPNGFRWLLLALLAPWVTDVAAYYAGLTFGNRRFLAEISPNKTIEGTVGGAVGCAFFGVLYFVIALRGDAPLRPQAGTVMLFGLLTGLVLGLVAQLGDWTASAIKRYTGRKDFGRLLPGHGGLMDRFDSVLYSFPATLVAAIIYAVI